jgi:hypothetical protein
VITADGYIISLGRDPFSCQKKGEGGGGGGGRVNSGREEGYIFFAGGHSHPW